MIAVYAILNPISRLRLLLNFRSQSILLFIVLITVLFFEFFFDLKETFYWLAPKLFDFFNFHSSGDGFNNNEAAFVTIIIWMIVSSAVYKFSKPRATKLCALHTFVERLHDEKRYLEIIELTTPYFPIITQAINKELPIQKWHYKWSGWTRDTNGGWAKFLDNGGYAFPSLIRPILRPVSKLIPARIAASEAAAQIIDLLLNSIELRKFLTTVKPSFAFELIKLHRRNYEGFTTLYLKDLVQTQGSHFYKEILDNQTSSINPKNKLLCGLLSDPQFAVDHALWKPVGDAIIQSIIEDQYYQNKLNMPPPYSEDELWSDPVFCAVLFFNIMVATAAEKEINYHMWLMYLSRFVEELVLNYEIKSSKVDLTDEFPTLANRLIYEIINTQGSWVHMASRLPKANLHVQNDAINGRNFSSIPRWAAIDLCDSIKSIIQSGKLPDKFKIYMFDCFLRDIKQISTDGNFSSLRALLITEILTPPYTMPEPDYLDEIRRLFSNVDHSLRSDVSDFEEAIDA